MNSCKMFVVRVMAVYDTTEVDIYSYMGHSHF